MKKKVVTERSNKVLQRKKRKSVWDMPKEKARVLLAKDVIKALNAKRIFATHGNYLIMENDVKGFEQFKKHLMVESPSTSKRQLKIPKQCGVCEIGSLFVAAVDRFDRLKVAELYENVVMDELRITFRDSSIVPYLENWFTEYQLRLMESAFELKKFDWTNLSREDADKAMEFGNKYDEGEPRMRAIMKNVIENKGTFIP